MAGRSRNFIDDTEVETQHRATGGWEVGLAYEAFFGRTTLDVDLSTPFTLGEQRLRYTGAVRVQRNGTPLTPQDRFAIGGHYTVRGFDGESSLSAEFLVGRHLAGAVVGLRGNVQQLS